jgi:hypothetical protein
MRVAAYVLVGDPSFLTPSIRAYYDRVERIVVSYDETATSWTGTPLPVEEALERIRVLDRDGKCDLRPGAFARPGFDPMDNETHQRNVALTQASDDADWVVQLDTDEVMPRPDLFFRAVRRADAAAADALEYPSRWLYTRAGTDRFLEAGSRLWGPESSYPGALAVRAGTTVTHGRQTDAALYRADVRPWNTDPAHPRDAVVHEVVPFSAAVLHYSWVRSEPFVARKVGWSGHSADLKANGEYGRWLSATRRPLRTALTAPLRRSGRSLRLVDAPDHTGEES